MNPQYLLDRHDLSPLSRWHFANRVHYFDTNIAICIISNTALLSGASNQSSVLLGEVESFRSR